jgi:hypothetical protein
LKPFERTCAARDISELAGRSTRHFLIHASMLLDAVKIT